MKDAAITILKNVEAALDQNASVSIWVFGKAFEISALEWKPGWDAVTVTISSMDDRTMVIDANQIQAATIIR
jgi:hypothetical protein